MSSSMHGSFFHGCHDPEGEGMKCTLPLLRLSIAAQLHEGKLEMRYYLPNLRVLPIRYRLRIDLRYHVISYLVLPILDD